jgi:hypothetical protein
MVVQYAGQTRKAHNMRAPKKPWCAVWVQARARSFSISPGKRVSGPISLAFPQKIATGTAIAILEPDRVRIPPQLWRGRFNATSLATPPKDKQALRAFLLFRAAFFLAETNLAATKFD